MLQPNPLTHLQLAEPPKRNYFLTSLLVLLAGLLSSGYVTHLVKVEIDADAQRGFIFDTQEAIFKIEARLHEHEQVLRGAAALFDASSDVSRTEFQSYARRILVNQNFVGVQGIGFAQLTPKAQLPAHIARVQQEGFPGYRVFPAGDRDAYSPNVYIEPFKELNVPAFGFDMYSDAVRRAAMEEARDSNRAALSGKVVLLQEAGIVIQPGTLMYMPVYRQKASLDTVEQRRAAIVGWVHSPLRMHELMQGILQNWNIPGGKVIQLKVYDGDTLNAANLLFDSHPTNTIDPLNPSLLHLNRLTHFNGRVWTLGFHHLEGGAAQIDYSKAWIALAVGMVITVLLFLLTLAYLNTLRHAGLISDRLTATKAALDAEIQLHQAEEEVENEWFRLQSTALEVCANAILIADSDGVVLWANPAFCKLSGYDRADVIGQKPEELVKSGVQDKAYYEAMWNTVLAGKSWHGELVNRRKNGVFYNEEMTITPVTNTQGVLTHFIAVKQDITLHKQVEASANAANQAKSMFLANMSHEIRTPMNGVVGMVDVLQQTQLEPVQHRMLNTIQKSALTLLNILNDILDFSKIEAGRLDIELIPVHVGELVEAVMQLMVATASAKSVDLSLYVSPALPHRLITDPTRLRQVLLNLLGNAIKFTNCEVGQTGSVVLYVEPCTLALGQGGVQFRIVDRGIGMSPQVRERLFQPFMQADESTARKFGGTGLGLSISQRLTEMLGGHIGVRSTLGEGSEFVVELPLVEAPPTGMAFFGPRLTGVHVISVNPDAVLEHIVSSYCLEAGATFASVGEMAAVRQHLQQRPPEAGRRVVVLGQDLQPSAAAPDLPANVGLVYLVRANVHTRSEAITVNAYPLHCGQLIQAIAWASGLLIRESGSSSHPGERDNQPVMTVEQAVATNCLILLAEDNETNRDVMQQQLRLLGYACEVAEDGWVALEMWQTGRYALLLTDCHMPRMDGFELTAAIRLSEPEGTHLPIIAITANAMQGEAQRCIARGMDDYLCKPMRMADLAPLLEKWLSLPKSFAAKPQKDSSFIADADPLTLWNSATLGEMVGDDRAMQHSLLQKFLTNAQRQVKAIEQAISEGALNDAGDLAHALKSSSRMVGAFQLGELSEAMETAGVANDASACLLLISDVLSVFGQTQEMIQTHLSKEGLT